jgi:hypothetical protein
MPKRISECSKAHLINVPLPQHGSTYTVISHQFVIDYVHQALALAGFNILHEEYRCTADGQIAQGIHKLAYNNDPELSMMFAWTNSYNKQIKFKCIVGAYIETTSTVMVSGDMGVWIRKHMGTADTETKDTIDEQIKNAHQYYNQLLSDKNEMIDKTLDIRKKAQLLGILFAEYGILTTEQASIVKNFIDRPMKNFTNPDSLWTFYNAITIALQQSHPRTWMEDQRVLHYFIDSIYKFPKQVFTAPVAVVEPTEIEEDVVDPDQMTIFDVIEEEEIAVCPPPAEIQIHIESDEEYAKRVAEIEGEPEIEEPEVEDEFAAEDNVDDVIQYTDPAGNTFEAPIVEAIEEPKVERLSLDDILIRIPNAEKARELEKSENDLFDMEQDLALGSDEEDEDLDSIPDFF